MATRAGSIPWIVAGVSVLLAVRLGAQATASAPVLKAAFVYNFLKFAEWPVDAATEGPVNLCVFGDAPLADALEATVKGRRLDGREIAVVRVRPEAFRACHLLYLAGVDAARSTDILRDLKGAPILTVSDREHFAESGGVAGLFAQNGKMRFAINVAAAERAHLRISSKLLSLGTIVQEAHAAP
jgi:hypothetical protein